MRRDEFGFDFPEDVSSGDLEVVPGGGLDGDHAKLVEDLSGNVAGGNDGGAIAVGLSSNL